MADFFKGLFGKKQKSNETVKTKVDKMSIDSLKTGDNVDYETIKEFLQGIEVFSVHHEDSYRFLLCDEAELAVIEDLKVNSCIIVRYKDMMHFHSEHYVKYMTHWNDVDDEEPEFVSNDYLKYVCEGKIRRIYDGIPYNCFDRLTELCNIHNSAPTTADETIGTKIWQTLC